MPYIGITALTLYASLGMYALAAGPVYHVLWRRNSALGASQRHLTATTVALGAAILGTTIKMISFHNYQMDGLFTVYAIGHVFVAFAVFVFFSISIVHHKSTARASYLISDLFASIATGLAIATFVTQIIYTETDKFFTKADLAQVKNLLVMVFEWIAILIASVLHWRRVKKAMTEAVVERSPTKSLDNPSLCYKFWWAQPFAVLLANAFYTY